MKHAPATIRPGQPARSWPMWIASSVEVGPGIRLAAPIRSSSRSRVIQPRRRTTSSSIIAMCAAGPPNAVNPSRANSHASSPSAVRWPVRPPPRASGPEPSESPVTASRRGRQPGKIVEPECLLQLRDLLDRALEAVIAKHLVLLVLELLAEFLVRALTDQPAQLG